MPDLTLTFSHRVNGTLTDVTSAVLSDPDGTFGVERADTHAVVVADGTAMTHEGTGLYTYTFTEPDVGISYRYYVESTYGGLTSPYLFTANGGTASKTSSAPLTPKSSRSSTT